MEILPVASARVNGLLDCRWFDQVRQLWRESRSFSVSQGRANPAPQRKNFATDSHASNTEFNQSQPDRSRSHTPPPHPAVNRDVRCLTICARNIALKPESHNVLMRRPLQNLPHLMSVSPVHCRSTRDRQTELPSSSAPSSTLALQLQKHRPTTVLDACAASRNRPERCRRFQGGRSCSARGRRSAPVPATIALRIPLPSGLLTNYQQQILDQVRFAQSYR